MEYLYDSVRGTLSPIHRIYTCPTSDRYAEALARVGDRGELVKRLALFCCPHDESVS